MIFISECIHNELWGTGEPLNLANEWSLRSGRGNDAFNSEGFESQKDTLEGCLLLTRPSLLTLNTSLNRLTSCNVPEM